MLKVNKILYSKFLKMIFISLLFILVINSLSIILASMDSLFFNLKLYEHRVNKIAFFIEPIFLFLSILKIDALFANMDIFTSSSFVVILLFYLPILLIIFISLLFSLFVYKGVLYFVKSQNIGKSIIIFIFLQLYSISIIILSNAKLTKIGFLFNVNECKTWHIIFSLAFSFLALASVNPMFSVSDVFGRGGDFIIYIFFYTLRSVPFVTLDFFDNIFIF